MIPRIQKNHKEKSPDIECRKEIQLVNGIKYMFYHKERIRSASRLRLTGKVSAKLTKGVSVSRHEKRILQNGIKYLPVILERSEESGLRLQDLTVLTCVHQLAPVASQARHFPPRAGEATAK